MYRTTIIIFTGSAHIQGRTEHTETGSPLLRTLSEAGTMATFLTPEIARLVDEMEDE